MERRQKIQTEGFFTKKEVSSTTRPDGKTYSCVSCGLYKECKSPRMVHFGNFKKGILNIGEAPGRDEDRVGKQFQGKTGKLLQKTYRKLGIDLFEDCLNINAVNCRPVDSNGDNRTPTNYEVECCRKSVLKVIADYKPKVIILLGNSAVYSLLGHRWKKDLAGITKWRGWTIPDQDFKSWICPTFHPSYVERSFFASISNKEQTSVEEVIWMQDLKQAFEKIKEPLYIYKEPNIEIITDLYMLTNIRGIISFDYETTGLKPHAPGHRIVTCSIATSEDHVYVFVMPPTKREWKPFIELLADPTINKMGHNIKFEEIWSVVRLGQPVISWIWDSMIASHILDNRQGITGLKFQTYVNFGLVDYSSEIDPYLEADRKNANSLNRIMEFIQKPRGREELLHYNALDSIHEYRLAMKQRLIMSDLPF